MNCYNFAASNGWLFSFFKRNNISINDFNKKIEDRPIQNEVVYEEEIQEEVDDESTNNFEQTEITEEIIDDDDDDDGENEIKYTVNWRDWCRFCGDTDSLDEHCDLELLETIKHLVGSDSINEDFKLCRKCTASLEDMSKMMYKGRLVGSMFDELEEREKMNCLTIESVFSIRQEYGFNDEYKEILVEEKEVEDNLDEFEEPKQQMQHKIKPECQDPDEDYKMQNLYEVDYLEDVDSIDDQDKMLQQDEDVEEYEMVEEETIEEIDEQYSVISEDKTTSKLLKDEEGFNFICHVCHQTFERMCFLTNHTRKEHDCLPQVACSCGRLLATYESLMAHKRKHSIEVGEFYCDLCNANFVTKAGLSIHIKFKHEKVRPSYRCSVCDKEFKDAQSLRCHERVHLTLEQRQLVECKICSKKLANKYSLNQHIKSVHQRQKTLICHLCTKQFSNKSNLKSHLISHTTEYVTCDICDSVFKNKVSLQSHRKIHKPKESFNYPCPECDKRFQNRNHLERHQISHSDVRNFRCNFEGCEMAYKWEKDLKNHISAVHNDQKNHKCLWCNKFFVDVANLRKHKLRYHPEELAEFELKHGRGRRQLKTLM